MYVCIIYIYLYIIYIYIYIYIYILYIYIYIYYIYIYIYIYLATPTYYLSTCNSYRMHITITLIYLPTNKSYRCMYPPCFYIYIYIYIYAHAHPHTYMCVYPQLIYIYPPIISYIHVPTTSAYAPTYNSNTCGINIKLISIVDEVLCSIDRIVEWKWKR